MDRIGKHTGPGRKKSLVNDILILFIASMLLLSGSILILQFGSYRKKFVKQSEFINDNYKAEQMAQVKREVERATDLIRARMSSPDTLVESIVKERIYEVYSIIENIYNSNMGKKEDSEIIQMVRDAVRPIRFSNGQGYFFITDMAGNVILNANQPDIEGSNLLQHTSTGVRMTMADMINLLLKGQEARYTYLWTKPDSPGDKHEKISFIKRFDPYDWVIGTGLYTEDVMEVIKSSLLEEISQIRFGKEGYIFINTLDGDALISSGRVVAGSGRLWEQAGSDEQAMRALFQKEYAMAMSSEGGYIYYDFPRLTGTGELSTKVSFIYGIRELNWLIGAGIYLDDVRMEIDSLQNLAREDYLKELGISLVLTLLIILSFLGLLIIVRRMFIRDFLAFDGFFDKAVRDEVIIDRDSLQYSEFRQMADKANKMQQDKLEAQRNLVEERERLRNSESKFRLLAENSRDMIYRMSYPEGIYEYVSPASEDILGYAPDEIQKEPFFLRKLGHPDWREWVSTRFNAILDGGVNDDLEYKVIGKKGEEIWVSQKFDFVRDKKGRITAVIGRLSNETKRKKIEEQLFQSNKLEAIGQLAGGVAHDFNNVLMGIINAAHYLKLPSGEIEEEGGKMVDLIINAATRAADLTSKLSAFSRKRTLFLKPVDIHALVDDAAAILKGTIDKKISLRIDKNAEDSFVQGDAAELQSVLMNLGINSSHALRDGGEIRIETSNRFLDQEFCDSHPFKLHPGLFIQIIVSDNGCGISPEHLPRIFEPYFSTKGKGTGLGLSTVYGAVSEHQGAILVESELETGTSFYILIPVIEERPEEAVKSEENKRRTEQILFVDDEPIIRLTGKGLLEKMGYAVLPAESGKSALELYTSRRGDIDLVIVDFMMPEMNGSELFYKLREIDPACKIIMISGFTRDENIQQLKDDGLLGFMKKPFTYDELSRLISELLD